MHLMNIAAATAELPGRTIEIGGVSVWDPSRFIILFVVIAVVVAAVVVLAVLERREDRLAHERDMDASLYQDGM